MSLLTPFLDLLDWGFDEESTPDPESPEVDTVIYIDGMPLGLTNVYVVIRNWLNKVYNGTTYVSPYVVSNIPSYAISAPETPINSGIYSCDMPANSPPGFYSWTFFMKLGASPAAGDARFGVGSSYWNGTSFGGTVLAPEGMDAVILEPETDTTPEINARQGIALAYISAPGGLLSGVKSSNPIIVKNPDGSIERMKVFADPDGNRTNVEIINMP